MQKLLTDFGMNVKYREIVRLLQFTEVAEREAEEHFFETTDIYAHGDAWHIDRYYECDCWDVFDCN